MDTFLLTTANPNPHKEEQQPEVSAEALSGLYQQETTGRAQRALTNARY